MLDEELRTHYSRIAVSSEAERRVREHLLTEIATDRHPRRVVLVAASVVTVAAAGIGATLLATHGNQHGAQPGGRSAPNLRPTTATTVAATSPASSPSPVLPPMSWQAAADTVVALLPGGGWTVISRNGQRVSNQILVEMVINDGSGAALVDVALTYPVDPAVANQPGGPGSAQAVGCKEETDTRYENGACTRFPDGSEVQTSKTYEYPADPSRGNKEWLVHAYRPSGFEVDISEWNAPTSKDSPASRPSPPLTIEEMTTIALSDRWLRP
jgi:hypothetical protein